MLISEKTTGSFIVSFIHLFIYLFIYLFLRQKKRIR